MNHLQQQLHRKAFTLHLGLLNDDVTPKLMILPKQQTMGAATQGAGYSKISHRSLIQAL